MALGDYPLGDVALADVGAVPPSITQTMTQRSIADRLEDACSIEAEACFGADPRLKSLYSNGRGVWRIFHRPLLEDEAMKALPGSLYLYALPFSYATSVGQAGTPVEYGVTHQFVMPPSVLDRKRGESGWHDDPTTLIRWYYTGGSHPNKPGNLFDPDNEGRFITTSLKTIQWSAPGAFVNRNALIEIQIVWQIVEDSQGNKL